MSWSGEFLHRKASWGALVLCLALAAAASAADPAPSPAEALARAKQRLASSETYDLKYKFAVGDVVRYQNEHLLTVDTRIKASTLVTKSRSISTKAWRVTAVDPAGQITFVHSVENVDMWQQVTGRAEVRYNSATDKTPPPEYAAVAEMVGQPLAEVTIDARGRIVARKNERPQFTHGEGQLTVPLPAAPVKIGDEWYRNEDMTRKTQAGATVIKMRMRYRLEKVEGAVAIIAADTQVLTPIDDPALRSLIIQRLMKGTIRFDMNAGRILSQHLDQDEAVVAFSGPESRIHYLGRYTELLITGPAPVATRPAGPARQ